MEKYLSFERDGSIKNSMGYDFNVHNSNCHGFIRRLRRGFLIALFVFCGAYYAFSQLWSPLPIQFDYVPRCFYNDSASGKLFMGGNFERLNGVSVYGIISFDGMQWDTLRSDPFAFPITCITKFNGKLYFAGFGGLIIYDGQTIERIPCGGQIRTMYEYEGQLLVGGLFQTIGGDSLSSFVAWDGLHWTDFHGSQQYFRGQQNSIQAIKQFRNELYVAGNIGGNGNLNEIMRWNGQVWRDVGGGINAGGSAWVNDLEVFHDELFVAGHFFEQDFGPGNCIAIWDGLAWRRIGDGLSLGQVSNLLLFEDKLYVSGQFSEITGIPASSLAYWEGQNWCAFGGLLDNATGEMAVYQDQLYVCGGFTSMNGVPIRYLAKWIGGNHVDTCATMTLGLPVPKDQLAVELFPNPTQAHFTLTLPAQAAGHAMLAIRDLSGRVVLPSRRYRAGERVEVDFLPAGVYFVEVEILGRVEVLKLVRE